jgi:hypothetical protein
MKPKLMSLHRRRGVSLIETTVALGLLITVMSVTASLAVRNQRLLADNRAYRLAVDELSNRLDLLVALPAEEAATAIEALNDEELTGPLAGATIEGAVESEDFGRRVSLKLTWPATVKRRPDIALSAWSYVESDTQEGQP